MANCVHRMNGNEVVRHTLCVRCGDEVGEGKVASLMQWSLLSPLVSCVVMLLCGSEGQEGKAISSVM